MSDLIMRWDLRKALLPRLTDRERRNEKSNLDDGEGEDSEENSRGGGGVGVLKGGE